jgi:antitoxin VapB
MGDIAQVFTGAEGQTVVLPAGYLDGTSVVHVRRDPVTGDVILSTRAPGWDEVFRLIDAAKGEAGDFLVDRDNEALAEREPLR